MAARKGRRKQRKPAAVAAELLGLGPSPARKAMEAELRKLNLSAYRGEKLRSAIEEVVAETRDRGRKFHENHSTERAPVSFPTQEMMLAISNRAGPEGALAEAYLLANRKTQDYDDGLSRDRYFPLGLPSFAQMIHVKSERLLSLSRNPRGTNFESARDTALDLINYASFLADWLQRAERAEADKRAPT